MASSRSAWSGAASTRRASRTRRRASCILLAGGPDKEVPELAGTFSAKSLGIEPQPIHLRLFVEDYLPGRKRVYTPTYLLYVLNPEQQRDLAHRATEQVAPHVAGCAR